MKKPKLLKEILERLYLAGLFNGLKLIEFKLSKKEAIKNAIDELKEEGLI